MNSIVLILLLLLVISFIAYVIAYLVLAKRLSAQENSVISVFLAKISKIPALIEVMRPYVSDPKAFDPIDRKSVV